MEIRGINGVGGISGNTKINKVEKKENDSVIGSDVAEISKEAKQLAEEAKVRDIMAKTPDVRQDRIDEVRAKLQNGDYNSDEVMSKVAEKLMKVLGL